MITNPPAPIEGQQPPVSIPPLQIFEIVPEKYRSAKILIIDDEEANTLIIEELLGLAGIINFCSTTSPIQGLVLFNTYQPDLILLDLKMPEMDGFTVLTQLQPRISEENYLPILILTGDTSPDKRLKALSMGARDFISKPFNVVEILQRIKNHLQTRFLYMELQGKNADLEIKVSARTRALEEAQIEILNRLAMAAEYRDDDTGQHAQRVGVLSALIAKKLGFHAHQVERLRQTAPLHDLGKIGLPDTVLLKKGKLDPHEFELMKDHARIGAKILSGSKNPLLKMAEKIAYSHHLCWDGGGYPDSIQGEEIPLVGRIVTVADVFDALTHQRPYKPAWPFHEAVDEIKSKSGTKFDPRVVEALLNVLDETELSDLSGELRSRDTITPE